jgi:hypothetical protein
MLSTANGNYQIVKAHQRRGYRVNHWTGYGWERATDEVFRSRAKAEDWIAKQED